MWLSKSIHVSVIAFRYFTLLVLSGISKSSANYSVNVQLRISNHKLEAKVATNSGVMANESFIWINWPSNVSPTMSLIKSPYFEFPLAPTCDQITANVFTITNRGVSVVSNTAVIKGQPEIPSAPVGLKVAFNESIFGHSLSWRRPNSYTHNCPLEFQLQQRAENQHVWQTKCNTTLEEYHLPLLQWNTTYVYRVRALIGEDKVAGPFSTSVSSRINDFPKTNLHIVKIESNVNGLTIHWKLPTPVEANYGYRVIYFHMTEQKDVDVPVVQTWLQLNNLSSCTEYTIFLTSHHLSLISLPVVTKAKTYPLSVPETPVINMTNSKCGSIFVSWKEAKPHEYVTYFTVFAISSNTRMLSESTTGTNEIWLHNLTCDVAYYVTVYAHNACGASRASTITEIIAMERVAAFKPEILIIGIKHSSITVYWTAEQPTRVGLVFWVTFQGLNTPTEDAPQGTMTTPFTNITIERLPSCMTFSFEVSAANSIGGSAVERRIVMTSPPEPTAPDNLQVYAINETAHNITWDAVGLCNSLCPIAYGVSIYNETGDTELSETTTLTYFILAELGPNQTYHYKVLTLAGEIPVASVYTDVIALTTPPALVNRLQSVWSYIIIVGISCILTAFVLAVLIFGRKIRTSNPYERHDDASKIKDADSSVSPQKLSVVHLNNLVGVEANTLPNGI